jgi:hypothetical protein
MDHRNWDHRTRAHRNSHGGGLSSPPSSLLARCWFRMGQDPRRMVFWAARHRIMVEGRPKLRLSPGLPSSTSSSASSTGPRKSCQTLSSKGLSVVERKVLRKSERRGLLPLPSHKSKRLQNVHVTGPIRGQSHSVTIASGELGGSKSSNMIVRAIQVIVIHAIVIIPTIRILLTHCAESSDGWFVLSRHGLGKRCEDSNANNGYLIGK